MLNQKENEVEIDDNEETDKTQLFPINIKNERGDFGILMVSKQMTIKVMRRRYLWILQAKPCMSGREASLQQQ